MGTLLIVLLLIAATVGAYLWLKSRNSSGTEVTVEKTEDEKVLDLQKQGPRVMNLGLGASFDIDPLMLKVYDGKLVTNKAASSHLIQAAGVVDLDGTKAFRFYTDDDAWLQVIASGGTTEDHVQDVKIFHYYDTLDFGSQEQWDDLLNRKIGAPTYELEGHVYHRVWTSATEYHQPVHMQEQTHDEDGHVSVTDQFVMLFEREIDNDMYESLFVSAEEKVSPTGSLERCLVLSTGLSLSPSQITIHG